MDANSHCRAWIPAREAALALGTTELRILMLIKQKALCGREVAGKWEVSAEGIESLRGTGIEPSPAEGKGCGGCSACS